MTIPGAKLSLCVLAVDDDANTVECTALLFCLNGHDVKTACSGIEALQTARLFADMILLDIGMPKLDGYEVARWLSHSACTEHSLIVAASGYAYPADERSCAEAAFDFYLSKPVNCDMLEHLSWLAEFRTRRGGGCDGISVPRQAT